MKEDFTGRMLWFWVQQPPSFVFSLPEICSIKTKNTTVLATAACKQQYSPFIIVPAWFETIFPPQFMFLIESVLWFFRKKAQSGMFQMEASALLETWIQHPKEGILIFIETKFLHDNLPRLH